MTKEKSLEEDLNGLEQRRHELRSKSILVEVATAIEIGLLLYHFRKLYGCNIRVLSRALTFTVGTKRSREELKDA